MDENLISQHLDTRGQDDPDLIIRAASKFRLSNFMMWQSAYTEFAFLAESRPAFTLAVFENALACFKIRTRRFGAGVESGLKG